MDAKAFERLVKQARSDPQFFHALVFEPESILAKLDFVDRGAKGAIIAADPAEIVARTIGVVSACGNTCTSSCDNTCGGSCGYTTNLQGGLAERGVSFYARLRSSVEYCGNTCTSSCDNTCGGSCGYTTNIVDRSAFGGVLR
jgi:hypothetical protein